MLMLLKKSDHSVMKKLATIRLISKFKFGAAQVNRSGNYLKLSKIRTNLLYVVNTETTFENIVNRWLTRIMLDPKSGGCITLRIHVNDKNMETGKSQSSSNIDSSSGLTNTTLLICHSNETSVRRFRVDGMIDFIQPRSCFRYLSTEWRIG